MRAAQHKLPVGLVAALDVQLRAQAAGDRLDEVLDELDQVRDETGSPPLAAPIGQILASQALLNVLSANRYGTMVDELRDLVEGAFGHTPGPIDPALVRAVELYGDEREAVDVDLDTLRDEADGLAASEEELLLLALFGEEAEPLLRAIRERSSGEESLAASGLDQERAARIREVVRIVQETGIGEITIEENGMRVSVRRTADAARLGSRPGRSDGVERGVRDEPSAPPRLHAPPRREPDGRHLLPRRRRPARRPSSRRVTPSHRARRCASSRR